MEEVQTADTIQYANTFYGSDRMLKDFHYQTREYTYWAGEVAVSGFLLSKAAIQFGPMEGA